MRKRWKQFAGGMLAAVLALASVDAGGITVHAAEGDVQDKPWPKTRYELEDGRLFNGEGADREIQIKTGSQFSKGKAIDTMDHNGQGAGSAIEPVIASEGLYQVILGYSKGRAYAEGRIALYRNEERVGYFLTKTTGTGSVQPVVDSDPLAVYLEEGDELSIRTDTGEATDAVACFDYLDISMWGGQYEAENGKLLLDGMKVVDTEAASCGKAVDGFEKTDGAGVEFPFEIPADGTYLLGLGYTRINYEIEDKIGVYVGEDRVGEVVLRSGGNTGDYIESDQVELELKQGDKVTIREAEASGDKGLLLLDYLKIQPKMQEIAAEGGPAFISALHQVVKGDTLTVPVENLPAGQSVTYTSSDSTVATVEESTGKITAVGAGKAVITANAGSQSFSCKVQVVEKAEELAVTVDKYEGEAGELISGDKAAPVIKSGSAFSGGKWVEIYDAGTGAAVKIKPEIEEEGEYLLTMCYAKGSMYPNDSVSVYVNSTKIGEFHMDSGDVNKTRNTNTLSAVLKPGDSVMVRKDAGQNSLFRYDYLMVSPVTAIPVRGIEMEAEAEVTNMETCQVKYTLSPENATDALVWSSSDPSVAEADGGIIWGRGEGTATITAKSIYNETIQAQMTVKVTANDKIESIASNDMEVLIDRNYPRVMEYRMIPSGNTMDGNTNALDTVLINGKSYKPEVTFEKKGADTALYTMQVKELNAALTLQAKVEGTILKFDFLEIRESGDKAQRIYTIELPEQNLVSVSSREASAQFAGSRMQPDITKNGDEFIDLTKAQAAAPGNYNYAFLSNGRVAAGIRSNAYSMNDPDQSAPRRVVKETVSEGSAFRTSLRSGSWVWRREDYTKKFITYDEDGNAGEIQTRTYEDQPMEEMPLVYVVLAEDLNDTKTVDWQDAAIRFRDVMYIAIGMDKIPDAVVQRLIMPQAGEGNYPFISSLDETKRVFLNTDGLGQIILDKYHNLGFWADFSVYDDHLGGLEDFRKFTSDATNLYNGFVGVHSNFTEVFAKTNQFSTESVQMNAAGTQPNSKGFKGFGFFLHQCYYADDTWEALSGQRRDAMRMFKEDVPDLGFIYSDVYYWNGWRGQQLEEDYAANGLAYFVEWPYISEESSPWSHWAVEKDYSPASNKGYSSDIARFIFNHTKDRWDNNAAKCDNQRVPSSCNLLMGADTTSYEGWVHDGVNRYDYIITKVFDNNLPTKYMQHFPILRMDKDEEGWGEHIWFEDGLEVFLDEDGRRVMTKDGKTVYTQDAYLLPWDEGDMQVDNSEEEKEVKLYHWNENGGSTTWQLPDSWDGLANVYLYRLTDQGKVEQRVVAVNNGSVTLEGIEAKVPYVIYKGEAAPTEDVEYGDGTFVKDPGFNYGDLRKWSLDFGTAEVRRNDTEGDDATTQNKYKGDLRNYELVMDGTDATQVSQTVTGLKGGEEYAASVMVEVEQGKEREASIQVDCGDVTVKNYTTKSILKQYDAYDSKASTYMLRMRVVFKVPEGEDSVTVRLCAAEGDGKVRFDNVRVYDTTTPTAPEDAVNVVFYQDFEYGKRENAPVRAENKVTYESYYPFNLGSAGGIREARAMLQTRHDPYTQNNKNAGWDSNTIMVDMALDGNHSLSVITDSLGAAFQTTPQNIRFEKGHTYRISFLYQNALDDTFAFVLGADQNSQAIYQESLKATPAKTGSRTFSHEFTSESDQTWFSINRIDRSVVVSENPNPFVIDNILVEDLSIFYTITAGKPEDGSYVVAAPEQAVAGDKVAVTVEVTDTDREVDQVIAETADGTEVVAEKSGNAEEMEYTFVMPAGDVTVTVVLKDRIADKAALAELIALAEAKQEGSYSEETWAPFVQALAEAKAVMENEAARPSEAEAARESLEAALKKLVRLPDVADKTALNAVLDGVADKEQGQYTQESWEAFEAALEAAKETEENVSAAQEEVNAARKALTDALAGLVEDTEGLVDESMLQAMINAAAAVDGTKFTEDSYAALVEAKEEAERFAGLRTDEAEAGNKDADGGEATGTDSTHQGGESTEGAASGSMDGASQGGESTEGAADGSTDSANAGNENADSATNGSNNNENQGSNAGSAESESADNAGQGSENTGSTENGNTDNTNQGSENTDGAENGSADSADQGSGNADNAENGSTDNETEAGGDGLQKCISTRESEETDIRAVIETLRAALVSLESVDPDYVDTTFLDAMTAMADTMEEASYTAESWEQMLQAKEAAEKADANDSAAVNAAAEALSKAIQGLQGKTPEPDTTLDWAVLNSLVEAAEGKQETDYMASAWKVLTDALAAAKALPEDADREALNEAVDALAGAIERLLPAGTAEKEELDAEILKAEDLIAEDYTPESWKALADALQAARLVSADPDAEQAEVDEALKNLKAAMEALEEAGLPEKADKEALNALIEAVSGKDQDAYTEESWNEFHRLLLAAQEVSRDEDATQAEVDEALKNLQEAVAGLVESRPQVDKSALETAVRDAESLKKADYTEESWAELEKALADAKYVLEDSEATQEKADQAAAALKAALEGLKKVEKEIADKKALKAVIEAAEALKQADYTEESWAELANALKAAQDVLANAEATQEEADWAERALRTAIDNLEKKQDEKPVDKTALQEAIREADSKTAADYTAESWAALQTALAAANAANGNGEVTQEAVNQAAAALRAALDGLKPAEKNPEDPKPENPDDPDNGSDDNNDGNGGDGGQQNPPAGGQDHDVDSVESSDNAPIGKLFVISLVSLLALAGFAAAMLRIRQKEEQDFQD